MIHVLDSSDITIHGIAIEDAPFWTVPIQLGRDIDVFNISLFNPHNRTLASANGDGFDISLSQNVHIYDSIIDASDDASAVRAGSGWAGKQAEVAPNTFGGRCRTENVLFERLEVRNGHGIGRCGEDGRGGVRNATWRDIVVNGNGPQHSAAPPNGVRFEASPTDGGVYEDITFERITGLGAGFGMSLQENHLTYKPKSHGGPYPSVVPGGPFPSPPPERPQLRNIVVRDVHLEDVEEVGTFFTFEDAPITNISLENVTIVAKWTEWNCAAWGKGDGKQERGRVYACGGAAVDVTPPLGCPARQKTDDGDWIHHVVVTAMRLPLFANTSDDARETLVQAFDPDIHDWGGMSANRGEFMTMRGIASSSAQDYEYDGTNQFQCNDEHVPGKQCFWLTSAAGETQQLKLFNTGGTVCADGQPQNCNGLAVTENDTLEHMAWGSDRDHQPLQLFRTSQTEPKWEFFITQGNARGAVFADAVTQDNIADSCRTHYGIWAQARFTQWLRKHCTPRACTPPGLVDTVTNTSFNIRAHIRAQRATLNASSMITEPVIHAFIRWYFVSQLSVWRGIVETTKRAAVKLGRPAPVVYGNQWGMCGTFPNSVLLSSVSDLVWIEVAEGHSSGQAASWNTFGFKLAHASGEFRKPVWAVSYQDKPDDKARAYAQATANAVVLAAGVRKGEKLSGCGSDIGPMFGYTPAMFKVHTQHTQFISRYRHLFLHRHRQADVVVIYSLPSVLWRRSLTNLIVDTGLQSPWGLPGILAPVLLTCQVLEENHIAYEVIIFGVPGLTDYDNSSLPRLRRARSAILPGADAISDRHASALTDWVRDGGHLVTVGDRVGHLDEELEPRPREAFADLRRHLGKGNLTAMPRSSIDDLTKAIKSDRGQAAAKSTGLAQAFRPANRSFDAPGLPQTVWADVWTHGEQHMVSVQLVNYGPRRKKHDKGGSGAINNATFAVRVPIDGAVALLFRPEDESKPIALPTTRDSAGRTVVTVPQIKVFAVVAFTTVEEHAYREVAAQARKAVERLKISTRGRTYSTSDRVLDFIRTTEQLLHRVRHPDGPLNQSVTALLKQACSAGTHLQQQVVAGANIDRGSRRSATIAAEAVLRFDFGSQQAPPGWISVHHDTLYTRSAGYGWASNSSAGLRFVETFGPDAVHGDYVTHRVDAVTSAEFSVDIKPGDYNISIVQGDANHPLKAAVTYVDVRAEGAKHWTPVLHGERLHSGLFATRTFALSGWAGGHCRFRFRGGNCNHPGFGFNVSCMTGHDCDTWVMQSVGWMVNAMTIQTMAQALTPAASVSLAATAQAALWTVRDWAVLAPLEDGNWSLTDRSGKWPERGRNGRTIAWQRVNSSNHWSLSPNATAPAVHIRDLVLACDLAHSAVLMKTYVHVAEPTDVEVAGSLTGVGSVEVNDEVVFRDELYTGLQTEEARGAVRLHSGWNTLVVKWAVHWGCDWCNDAATISVMPLNGSQMRISACGPHTGADLVCESRKPALSNVAVPRIESRMRLWSNGEGPEGGYASIGGPTLVMVRGTLLSIVEARKRASDIRDDAAWHDILIKRSHDQGAHWTAASILYTESGPARGNASVTIGNAAPVVDRVSGVVILMMCRNNSHVLMTRSQTRGATWAKPVDITAQVKPVQNRWGWFATTFSGVQLRHGHHAGRLVICCDHIKGQWKAYPSSAEHSNVIISDDGGSSWRPGASMANASTDECALAETSDGTLVINARSCVGAGAAAVRDCGSGSLHPPRVAHRMLGWSSDGGEHFGKQCLAGLGIGLSPNLWGWPVSG
jgi:hypothetical protein